MIDGRRRGARAGKLSPYTAIVVFSAGLLLSNFLWNSIMMMRPFVGRPCRSAITSRRAARACTRSASSAAIIWNVGMSLSIIASGAAGFAISYGLGQGATMVAALWGVFIWKEFKPRPRARTACWRLMFASFVVGLALIVYARVA